MISGLYVHDSDTTIMQENKQQDEIGSLKLEMNNIIEHSKPIVIELAEKYGTAEMFLTKSAKRRYT